MSNYQTPKLVTLGLWGALTLAFPPTSHAQTTDTVEWNRGQAELQKQLVPGMAPETYQQKLQQLGYKITSTNYSNPDYLEYEIVKGDQSWEVQIDVDDDTNKATEIDIARNVWQTDATRNALRDAQRLAQATTAGSAAAVGAATNTRRTMPLRNNQYSDRDRANTNQLIRELEALPVGRDREFYKNTLRERGFEITRVNEDDVDELDLEAVKDGNSVQMEVEFDEDTGRSTEVDASTLWAESESTTRTRKEQERSMGSSSIPDQRSQLNREGERLSREDTTQGWERPRGATGTPTTPNTPSDRTSSGLDTGMERRSDSGSEE
jgi:hypothetical protein